jgi:hypothetical protein
MNAEFTSLRARAADERFSDKTRYLSMEEERKKWEENLHP